MSNLWAELACVNQSRHATMAEYKYLLCWKRARIWQQLGSVLDNSQSSALSPSWWRFAARGFAAQDAVTTTWLSHLFAVKEHDPSVGSLRKDSRVEEDEIKQYRMLKTDLKISNTFTASPRINLFLFPQKKRNSLICLTWGNVALLWHPLPPVLAQLITETSWS